jgi:hypothetical protein
MLWHLLVHSLMRITCMQEGLRYSTSSSCIFVLQPCMCSWRWTRRAALEKRTSLWRRLLQLTVGREMALTCCRIAKARRTKTTAIQRRLSTPLQRSAL